MTLFLRMMLLAVLVLVLMAKDGAGEEVMPDYDDELIDNMKWSKADEEGTSDTSRLPLCAMEEREVRVGSGDEEIEYSPAFYKETRCKRQRETRGSWQVCSLPTDVHFPPWIGRSYTTCMQRWDIVSIFWRPVGRDAQWRKGEDKKIPSGCECMIMRPELVDDAEQQDAPRDQDPSKMRMMPVAVQRYTESRRYGRDAAKM